MYDAIDTVELGRKLKKLNKQLWIDPNHEVTPYEAGYSMVGLYCGEKYQFGIPRYWTPKYSIIALSQEYMEKFRLDFSQRDVDLMQDRGLMPQFWESRINQRIYLRGLVPILSDLARRGLIDGQRAEKLFKVRFSPKQLRHPATFIERAF